MLYAIVLYVRASVCPSVVTITQERLGVCIIMKLDTYILEIRSNIELKDGLRI